MNNKSRLSYILTVFAGFCLVGCGGCKQKQAEDVPALNQTPAAAAPAVVADDSAAKAAAEEAAAKAKAEDAAKVAKEKADADAKAAAEKQAAEDAVAKAKAEADAKAAAEAAKAAHEKQEAEAIAAAKTAAEAQAKAEEEAKLAAAKAADDAKAVEDAAAAKAAAEAAAKPVEAVAPGAAVAVDAVPALAKSLTTNFATTGITNTFGATHNRVVVQVNRTTNSSDLAIDRAEVTKSVASAFDCVKDVITSDNVNGKHNVKQVKAIHMAFEPESKALRIIPSQSLSNAPSVIVSSAVAQGETGAVLTVKAVDTRTGKAIWTESKNLAGETAPAAVEAPAAK